jgi:ABC-type Fe3+ transport system substrate-binding protein
MIIKPPLGRRTLLRGATALALGQSLPTHAATRAVSDGGGITDALVKAAKQEGTLTYYHVTSIDITNNWTRAFSQTYGITTKNVRGPGYPTWDKWLNESRVGRNICDVIQVTDQSIIAAADEEGFVAHYTPEAGPAIFTGMKQDSVWYALHAGFMGIGWNTTRASEADAQSIREQGWDALADPRWLSRYGTTTPASGGSDYTFWYLFMVDRKDRWGEPWLRRVAANKPDVFISKPPMIDRLAAGEYAIVDQATHDGMTEQFLKGAPVRWVFPDPTPTTLLSQLVSANAPHPNAARLFHEWALSAAGMAEWFKYTSVLPTRADVIDPRKAEKKDWYGQDWYADPVNLYLDYLKQPEYGNPDKPLIGRWNEIFGYQGAAK